MRYIALVLAVLLGACSTTPRVQTEVTAFHTLQEAPTGKTFAMVPIPDQEGSLEWRNYANLVSRRLTNKGLVRVDYASEADLAVFLTYVIDGGRTTVSSVPVYGQTGGGTTTTTTGYVGRTPISGSTYTPPTFGVTGYAPVEDTVYTRRVRVYILDAKRTTANKPAVVYESTATSVGSIPNLNVVMPYIMDAVFNDWPGQSGTTQRLNLPIRE